MAAPFVPTLVVQRWMNSILTGNATVVSAVGVTNIYPNVSASDVKARHITHGFGGPNNAILAKPMRAPIAQVSLFWDITAWEPSYSQQALQPVMLAIMGELIGADTRGTSRRFVDSGRAFQLDCDYVGPEVVPLESTPAGIWAPVRERFAVALRPAA